MGISLTDYAKMTFGQYLAAKEGYEIREARHEDWVRRQSWINMMGYVDKKKAPKDLKKWWPVLTDQIGREPVKRQKGRKLTRDELSEFIAKMR